MNEYLDAETRVRRRNAADALRVVVDNPGASAAEQVAILRDEIGCDWPRCDALIVAARLRAAEAAAEGYTIVGIG